MEIQSKLLGKQEIDPNTIISFPLGIPGFEDQTRFKLFHQEGSEIVFWLQAVDNADLTFSVSNPLLFNINYSFTLTDEEEKLLQITNSEELIILIVLHKDEESSEIGQPIIKGSIKSPLLINIEKRVGYQKVLAVVEQSITLIEKKSEIQLTEV
ncbi:flagellar assembly protein FliW [Methylomonas sp. AM2-LC]|uniref:flagellar assembly protein FliW n=1 Tax=Methylomonas sp. AM2-LC TaxID=3153301 RepID=UPI0032677673